MISKKCLLSIGILFGCMSCLFGNDENVTSNKEGLFTTSKKVYSKPKTISDIERPLLRPVAFKKEDTIANDQKKAESSSDSKKVQSVESILSLLKTERKKLQELENKYKKLERVTTEEGSNAKDHKADADKKAESSPTSGSSDYLQSSDKLSVSGTSSVGSEVYPIKDMNIRNGSSTAQVYTARDGKQSGVGGNNALNQRLVKIIKSVSPLDIAECFYKLCEYDNALQMYKLLTPNDASLDQYVWAQYQIANCYRNMKKFDIAIGEYQHFINQYPGSDLISQAKWYIDDINWWKSWYEKKNTLANNKLFTTASDRSESK